MKILIVGDENQKRELGEPNKNVEIVWVEDLNKLSNDADAYIDLLFVTTQERIENLKKFLPKPIIVNSVVATLDDTSHDFIRINGWSTFLKSETIEASGRKEELKRKADEILFLFNKKIQWVPDEVGFITPRIVSMIINEAYLALGEGVSTKEEINTAMQLGTAYPYGPFEWAEKIGIKNVASLLETLKRKDTRYTPAQEFREK